MKVHNSPVCSSFTKVPDSQKRNKILLQRNIKVTSCFENYKPSSSVKNDFLDFKRKKIKDRVKDDPNEVPAGIAIGLVELLGAGLAAIIPVPGARIVSGILAGDGIRRMGNSIEKVSQTTILRHYQVLKSQSDIPRT